MRRNRASSTGGTGKDLSTDLARRRKLGTVQVEQLRAGRERLLDAYLVVRRTLDEVTDELQRADAEAGAASEGPGRQHALDPDELLDLRRSGCLGARGAEPKAVAAGPPVADEKATATAPNAIVPRVAQLTKATGEAISSPEKQPATGPQAGTGAGDTEVVARTDAIESVRILRQEPPAPSADPPAPSVDEAAEAAGRAEAPAESRGWPGPQHDVEGVLPGSGPAGPKPPRRPARRCTGVTPRRGAVRGRPDLKLPVPPMMQRWTSTSPRAGRPSARTAK